MLGLLDNQTLTVLGTAIGIGVMTWFARGGVEKRRNGQNHRCDEHDRVRQRLSDQQKELNRQDTDVAVMNTRLGQIEEHVKAGFNDMRELDKSMQKSFAAITSRLDKLGA